MSDEIDLKSLIRFYPKPRHSFGTIQTLDESEICTLRIYLNKDSSSWVDVGMLPEPPTIEVLNEFWDFKPEKLGRIAMGNVPRYQQSYGKGYRFSGSDHPPKPPPDVVKSYLDWANTTKYSTMYDGGGFTQSFVNWYACGDHYIGPHADDESQIRVSPLGETAIISLNFQEGPLRRIFRIKPAGPGRERIDIEMPNGMILVMGGRMQKTHTHQVPKARKSQKEIGRRVNLTFRQFK